MDIRLSSVLKVRHLEIFVEVARRQSVTQAAAVLGLSQPAVTRSLRELEAVCGKPLVEKDGRGIRLSAYGEMFRDYAGRSLALMRDGVAVLQELGADEGPKVAIGALPSAASVLVPDTLAGLRAEGAAGRFSVVTGGNQDLLDQLRRGALDLVVGRLPAPGDMAGVTFEPLLRERVLAVVAQDHPLAGAPDLPAAALEAFPVLLPSEGSIIRPLVERLLLEQGLSAPRFPIETVSPAFGRRFVLAHRAVWFISEGVVRPELDSGAMRALPLETVSTLGPVGLCIRHGHQPSPAAARFCAALKRHCATAAEPQGGAT